MTLFYVLSKEYLESERWITVVCTQVGWLFIDNVQILDDMVCNNWTEMINGNMLSAL